MPDSMERLDRIRVIDKRIRRGEGIWSGEYYYEWSCGCRVYIPVLNDGNLGVGHHDVYCEKHSAEMSRWSEKQRAWSS
jgi:hypothetical protein